MGNLDISELSSVPNWKRKLRYQQISPTEKSPPKLLIKYWHENNQYFYWIKTIWHFKMKKKSVSNEHLEQNKIFHFKMSGQNDIFFFMLSLLTGKLRNFIEIVIFCCKMSISAKPHFKIKKFPFRSVDSLLFWESHRAVFG